MSLKARIEAVIYAAEEPVTLAQLTALFREEALLSRAALVAPVADASGASDAPGTDAVVDELLPTSAEPSGDTEGTPVAPVPAAESLEADTPPVPSSDGPVAAAPTENPEREAQSADREGSDPEAEKKAARARDREARDEIRRLIDELIQDYSSEDHGLEIREVAGGFRLGTRPEVHDAVRGFIKSLKPPMKLSLQALETLAVIAYKQPVTAPEIGEIRGVDSGGVLGSLVARKLITTAGRKQVIGRPILYKTTKEFLLRFGLRDLNELPSIEEFEKMASELTETEEEASAVEADLPFAQNEISAVEENAESASEAGPEAPPDDAPTSENDAALEEPQP
ncbi:MAG: SMC-Scp complex subunit ScpB [Acidobacteriaceae bacterium]